MKCPNCRNIIPRNVRFCAYCGHRQGEPEIETGACPAETAEGPEEGVTEDARQGQRPVGRGGDWPPDTGHRRLKEPT